MGLFDTLIQFLRPVEDEDSELCSMPAHACSVLNLFTDKHYQNYKSIYILQAKHLIFKVAHKRDLQVDFAGKH